MMDAFLERRYEGKENDNVKATRKEAAKNRK
jgi:hypothetical protein